MKTIQEIIDRLMADTPYIFVKIRNLGLSLAAVGTSLLAIPNAPAYLVAYAGKAILAGSVMAAISQLTVKDPIQK